MAAATRSGPIAAHEDCHSPTAARYSSSAVAWARAKANERSRQGVTATIARPNAKRDYFYRGLLRCGICGLRMWGNHRRRSTYYACQPSHQRSKDIPADHPQHVYLNEQRLNDALLPFLATALFSPERSGYWRTCLEAAAEPKRPHQHRHAPRRSRLRSPTSNGASAASS